MRGAVIEHLRKYWHFDATDEYKRTLKSAWICEDFHHTIKDPEFLLDQQGLHRMSDQRVAFYYTSQEMTSSTVISVIYQGWIRNHSGRSPIEFQDFFTHLVQIYPEWGPQKIQDIITVDRSICREARSPLDEDKLERESSDNPGPYPLALRLSPTYRRIIIIMDHYLPHVWDKKADIPIDLQEQAKLQNVLLVRTGEDSTNFDELRNYGLCLHLNRSDILAKDDNVVRVSLGTAVKFVAELLPNPSTNWEETAQRHADEWMNLADTEGVDNDVPTWVAVRRVKAERMGEEFMSFDPYQFSRWFPQKKTYLHDFGDAEEITQKSPVSLHHNSN